MYHLIVCSTRQQAQSHNRKHKDHWTQPVDTTDTATIARQYVTTTGNIVRTQASGFPGPFRAAAAAQRQQRGSYERERDWLQSTHAVDPPPLGQRMEAARPGGGWRADARKPAYPWPSVPAPSRALTGGLGPANPRCRAGRGRVPRRPKPNSQ